MDLKQAAANVSRSTGMRYFFKVHTTDARKENPRDHAVAVIGLNIADAWGIIGDAVTMFMNGPDGRFVHSITLEAY